MFNPNNWTMDQVRRTVITSLEIEKQNRVALDVSHDDWKNIQRIVAYAKSLGYDAEEHPGSESVVVSKRLVSTN